MSQLDIKRHRDGTVSVWSVYSQTWVRATAREVYADDKIMTSLSAAERGLIQAIAFHGGLTAGRRLVRSLRSAADAGGVLQASDMLRVAPGARPTAHGAQTIDSACRALRLEYVAAVTDSEK